MTFTCCAWCSNVLDCTNTECPCHTPKEEGERLFGNKILEAIETIKEAFPSTPKTEFSGATFEQRHDHETGADSWEADIYDAFKENTPDRAIDTVRALILKSKNEGYEQGVAEWYKDEEYERGKNDEREAIEKRIGFLRQWLNEKPESRLVSNDDIAFWLGLEKL